MYDGTPQVPSLFHYTTLHTEPTFSVLKNFWNFLQHSCLGQKRESKTGKDNFSGNKINFDEYNKEKLKQTPMTKNYFALL